MINLCKSYTTEDKLWIEIIYVYLDENFDRQ